MDLTVAEDADESTCAAEDRRGLLQRLGATAAVASIAGCAGSGDGSTDGQQSPDDSPPTDDGAQPPSENRDGGTTDYADPQQRVVELRAILREFEDGYDESVLAAADDVRQRFRESVVFVDLQDAAVPYRLASGWFVADGRVVTGSRKLGALDSISAYTADGDAHDATVVRRHDGAENLALLELDASRPPIERSTTLDSSPDPNQPLVQIGQHDEYGHWVATVGDYVRTQSFGDSDGLIDEHWSNVPGLPGVGGAPVFTLDAEFVGMTNGAEPRSRRGDSTPEPLNDYLYDWQMSHREWLNHLDAEQTFATIESWL